MHILWLLLLPLLLPAAPYSILVDSGFQDRCYDITEDHHREISAVGFSQHFQSEALPESAVYSNAFDYLQSVRKSPGEQIRLLRLNGEGAITFDFSNNLSRFNRAVSVVKTADNGYFVGGYTQEGELLLLRLSVSGSILFEKTFGTRNFDRMNRLVALRDGGVLAVGSSMTSRSHSDPLYEQGLGLNDIFLSRFDQNGKVLWSKKYGTLSDDRGMDAAEAFDGSLLILSTSSDEHNRSITLMRLSEEGDKIWLKQYEKEGVLGANRLISLRDDHFIAAISFYDEKKSEQSRLLKFDLQRNILDESDFENCLIEDIKERADGAIIGVGSKVTSRQTQACVTAFDASLQPLWQHDFSQYERSSFHALSILHNGLIAAAGEATQSPSQESDIWIVKLTENGTLASLPLPKNGIYADLHTVLLPYIQNHSITLDENLMISFTGEGLQYAQGIATLSAAQKKLLERLVTPLLETLYRYRDQIETLQINGHASSEWGNATLETRYLNNLSLSSARSYHLLRYLFTHHDAAPYQKWLTTILSSNGHSFADPIKETDENENEIKSRRVSLKVEMK